MGDVDLESRSDLGTKWEKIWSLQGILLQKKLLRKTATRSGMMKRKTKHLNDQLSNMRPIV